MLPIIAIKGSAGELGFQHGSRCQEMIQKNIQLYFRVFQHYAQLDRSQAIKLPTARRVRVNINR